MCHGIVTENIERCPERTAEVSRGRSTHASEEGPNDRKGQLCLGLNGGSAQAILPRQVLGRHGAVKPQRMLTREVKPSRRPQSTNAQPACLGD